MSVENACQYFQELQVEKSVFSDHVYPNDMKAANRFAIFKRTIQIFFCKGRGLWSRFEQAVSYLLLIAF